MFVCDQITDLKTHIRELKLNAEQYAQTTDLLQLRFDEMRKSRSRTAVEPEHLEALEKKVIQLHVAPTLSIVQQLTAASRSHDELIHKLQQHANSTGSDHITRVQTAEKLLQKLAADINTLNTISKTNGGATDSAMLSLEQRLIARMDEERKQHARAIRELDERWSSRYADLEVKLQSAENSVSKSAVSEIERKSNLGLDRLDQRISKKLVDLERTVNDADEQNRERQKQGDDANDRRTKQLIKSATDSITAKMAEAERNERGVSEQLQSLKTAVQTLQENSQSLELKLQQKEKKSKSAVDSDGGSGGGASSAELKETVRRVEAIESKFSTLQLDRLEEVMEKRQTERVAEVRRLSVSELAEWKKRASEDFEELKSDVSARMSAVSEETDRSANRRYTDLRTEIDKRFADAKTDARNQMYVCFVVPSTSIHFHPLPSNRQPIDSSLLCV